MREITDDKILVEILKNNNIEYNESFDDLVIQFSSDDDDIVEYVDILKENDIEFYIKDNFIVGFEPGSLDPKTFPETSIFIKENNFIVME